CATGPSISRPTNTNASRTPSCSSPPATRTPSRYPPNGRNIGYGPWRLPDIEQASPDGALHVVQGQLSVLVRSGRRVPDGGSSGEAGQLGPDRPGDVGREGLGGERREGWNL